MKKEHNKLVRDNIPNIIAKSNKTSMTSILSDDQEYLYQLKRKLTEEANEVLNTNNNDALTEELADVLEVIEAIMQLCDISLDEVMKVKEDKANKNGKFNKRIYLVSVDDCAK